MEFIGFNYEELSQLEALLQVSTNVCNLIDSLCQLEINEKKDSQEHYQTLLELTRAINIENEKYRDSDLTYQHCFKFAKLLSSQTNLPLFDNKPTTSFNNYNNRIIKRVVAILITRMQNNPDFHRNIIPETLIQQVTNIGGITNDDFFKEIQNSVKIQTTLDTDINSMFLSILEDTIIQRQYQQYKEELIKAKYCIATSNKELELFLLQSKFHIPDTVYINSKIINELLQEREFSYNIIRFTELKTKAQIEINKLLQIRDSEYSNPTTYINSIISSCYLRALLSLMKDDEINDFNQEFHDLIDNPQYLREHINDRISENIIITCFKCFKSDKAKTRILSTKSTN